MRHPAQGKPPFLARFPILQKRFYNRLTGPLREGYNGFIKKFSGPTAGR
ncbi:hypothetical protein HMPREF0262_03302 [Clostridium sp. ATCC 29733]|nr:hypothetical protein HMPREF0262_03302 [Clostridium sp. ATCC 29733]